MALNKEFERYKTKIEIPASVVLETIFSTDNKDVEILSRWALKHGFVDLVEKENGKYYQLQNDYEKQSFYIYLSKKERKQYDYEDYLIKQLEEKENIIKGLDNTIENLEEVVEQKENKLKEVREYIEEHYVVKKEGTLYMTEDTKGLLEILDKEVN